MFILVVDDDEVMRELLTMLLESEGHRVQAAESAELGLKAVREMQGAFDVVLTDLRMPDTEATAMLQELRRTMSATGNSALGSPAMRLLGMSGSEAGPKELELLDGFLLKPFTVEEFMEIAERARVGAVQAAPMLEGRKRDAAVLDEATYARMAKSLPAKALRELYDLTLDDVRKRTATIREAAAAGDAATSRSEAHAMKGGCGMVGAMELRAIAADIEAGAAVDNNVLNEIDSAAKRLRRMLDTLI